jgi:hypothetical protein
MTRVGWLLLLTATAWAAGCLGGSGGSGGVQVSPPPTQMEMTYFGMLRRSCPAGTRCMERPLRRITCPPESRCVRPIPQAELVACPRGARAGLHCYAVPPTLSRGPRPDPWIILQQRELSCGKAATGGYADPAAACSALADYVRSSKHANGTVCSCPPELWPDAAAGTFRGRQLAVDLSTCATCGLGGAAIAARNVLTPALGS